MPLARLHVPAAGLATLAIAALGVGGCAPEPRWCKANFALAAMRGHEAFVPPTAPPDEMTPEERELVRARARDLEDEALGVKVAVYIRGCTNASAPSVYRARRRYLAWAPVEGLTGRETNVLGLSPVLGAEGCAGAAAKAATMKPLEPGLEAAGSRYSAALTALAAVVAEATTYYDGKGYRTDKLALGKELHPRLLAAFAAMVAADLHLRAVTGSLTRPIATRQLARIDAAEGKRFRYRRREVLELAKDLVEIGDPTGEQREVSPETYAAALAALEGAFAGLREYGAAHRAELSDPERARVGADAAYDAFTRTCGAYVTRARAYGECLGRASGAARTKDGKVDLEALRPCPGGGRRELTESYDAFILSSNANPFFL